MNRVSTLTIVLLTAGCFSALSLADTKIVMKEGSGVSDGADDLPPEMRQALESREPTTAVYWFGSDRAAWIGATGRLVSRLDRGESYAIDDATKSYTVIDLGSGESPVSTGSAKLVRTGETRKIGSWNAVRYEMTVDLGTGDMMEATLWASDEVEVDADAYHAVVRSTAAQTGMDWMLEALEIEGFPVRQEFRTGPIETWLEVVSITEESAPAGTYEPPAGYSRSN